MVMTPEEVAERRGWNNTRRVSSAMHLWPASDGRADTWFHLHPHAVRPAHGDQVAPHVDLCPDCASKVSRYEVKVPKLSVARGVDFGNPAALGLAMDLSILEKMLIARVVPLFQTVSLMVAGNPDSVNSDSITQTAIRGHAISMKHDALQTLCNILPRTDLSKSAAFVFVGTAGQWIKVKQILPANLTQVRPRVVLQWLHALKDVGNPFYADVEIADDTPELHEELLAAGRRVVDDCLVAEDPVTREVYRQAGSDLARNRPHADNDSEDVDHFGPEVERDNDISNVGCVLDEVFLTSSGNITPGVNPGDSEAVRQFNDLCRQVPHQHNAPAADPADPANPDPADPDDPDVPNGTWGQAHTAGPANPATAPPDPHRTHHHDDDGTVGDQPEVTPNTTKRSCPIICTLFPLPRKTPLPDNPVNSHSS